MRRIRQDCLNFRDKGSNRGSRMENAIRRPSCWLKMRVRTARGYGLTAIIRPNPYLSKAIRKHFTSMISNKAIITMTPYSYNYMTPSSHNYMASYSHNHNSPNGCCRPLTCPYRPNSAPTLPSTSSPQTRSLQQNNTSHHQIPIHCKNSSFSKVVRHTKISQVRMSKNSNLMNVTESYTRTHLDI